jgi:NAD(P)H-dependent flavin oxidoreductase YrpB (nitropropane dioxygenase family)
MVRSLIQAAGSTTDRPLNVNFISILVNEAQIQACTDERVPIVSFHWGHPPQDSIVRLHDVGIKVWEQVGSVEATKQAVEAGVDLIVAQGSEAGGHNYGRLATFVLVPTIREALGQVRIVRIRLRVDVSDASDIGVCAVSSWVS